MFRCESRRGGFPFWRPTGSESQTIENGGGLATSQAGPGRWRAAAPDPQPKPTWDSRVFFFIDATHSLSRRSNGIPATSSCGRDFPSYQTPSHPPASSLAPSRPANNPSRHFQNSGMQQLMTMLHSFRLFNILGFGAPNRLSHAYCLTTFPILDLHLPCTNLPKVRASSLHCKAKTTIVERS